MRVTTNAMFTHISESTGNHFNAISNQMSHSQYRVLQAGDDPIAQGRIINLNRSINELTGFKTSANVLQTKLSEIDSRIDSYGKMFNDLTSLINKGNSGSMNESDLKQLSKQMNGMLDDIAQILNMKNTEGDYVFGGTITDKPPFAKETKTIEIDGVEREVEVWVYQGNTEVNQTQIGASVSLPSTVVGGDLVSAEGTTIFETIAKAQYYFDQGLEMPENILEEVQDSMDVLLDQSISFGSEVGYSHSVAERNTDMYQGMIDEYVKLKSSSEDADFIRVTTEIKKQQQILMALTQSGSILMEMATLRIE